jgi:RHS repeat-associated protein
LIVLNRIATDGGVEYLHADGNANIGWITDDAGTPRPGPALGPWGEPLDAQPAPGAAGFAGTVGVRAEAGGLLDMRARLYDPHLGRFISRDPWPATLPGPATLNRYAYALNDPISLLDPSGLFCWTGKNAEGKCRGLKDVVHRYAKPLEVVSTVATVVAVTAVGLTVACPPCAPITLPLAGSLEMVAKVSRGVAIGAGLLATGSECVAAGSITSFDCAKGLIAAGVGRVGGTLIESTLTPLAESGSLSLIAKGIGQYGSGVFDLLAEGTSSAISAVRK